MSHPYEPSPQQPAPPHHEPPPPTWHGGSHIQVHLRKPSGLLGAEMVAPILRIDGHQVPVRWGTWVIPVPPRRYVVQASSNYLWEFGRAELPVTVAPGQSPEVHYSGPVFTSQRGRIGHTVQDRPGHAAMTVVTVLAIAVGVLLVVGAVVLPFLG